ncbi:hypothetical protein DOY81_013465 [Sarcophaga bullata]|nr:hypothetical protein DOY81_013465 [Sarcophaga bullata]
MNSTVTKNVDITATNIEQSNNIKSGVIKDSTNDSDDNKTTNILNINGSVDVINGDSQIHVDNISNERRDSTQVWTPLLENGTQNSTIIEDGELLNAEDPVETIDETYDGAVSNNNDWKVGKTNSRVVDNSSNRSNNNSPLINGKPIKDKYGEHDPLTGLYVKVKQESHTIDDDLEPTTESEGCGLFGCTPKWAGSLASTHMFMVVFLLAYILQGMYMTYFVSVITTIEKLFQIKSKTTGFLLSASEMGQISTAMLLTYYAGRGHRPRWIACGMVLFSIAAFACALPHFIFGNELIHSATFLSKNNPTNLSNLHKQTSSISLHRDDITLPTSSVVPERHIEMNLCRAGDVFNNSTSGIHIFDDNVASKQSAMYMAITIGVRILGQHQVLLVGSVCTRWYVNFTNPGFDASDPRWIGAWWLGPVVIGV